MIQVGAFDAKTHLSSLLDRVIQGEEILITRRGTPVARLVPAEQAKKAGAAAAIEKLRAIRRGVRLAGLDWRHLRDQGRK